jgi:uncharacterized protein YuzE
MSPISDLSKFDYDFENDTIFFYGTDKKYKTSIDIDNIILDIGEDNSAIAIEILDASKKFSVPKSDLSNILHFNAEISISKETIKVVMKLVLKKRNGLINKFTEACGLNNNDLPVSIQEMALSY